MATAIVAAEQSAGHSFDVSETVWQLLDVGTSARMLAHEHIAGGARNEDGCRRMVISAAAGQSAQLGCTVPPTAVLDELEVRLWVKASRSHIQLAAGVVLPRSTDPRGGPASAVVRGPIYDRPGHWQQLVLKDVPGLLSAEVRVMRSVPGANIDPREAYLDRIILLFPGDPHGVEVVTDELQVDGIVLASDEVQLTSFPADSSAGARQRDATPSLAHEPAAGSGAGRQLSPRLQGSLSIVDGKPFLPRAVQWRGEPLQFLADLGFNTIQLSSAPTAEQITEASRYGLWFICSPPRPDDIRRHELGQAGDRVLAWYLDVETFEGHGEYARNWAELIRQHDAVDARPVVVAAGADWHGAGRTADILAAHNSRAGQLTVAQYSEWLEARLVLNRPGVPHWACLPTQWGEQVRQQAAVLTGNSAEPLSIDAHQLDALVHVACAHDCRGFVFTSQSPLNEDSAETQGRAMALELINRQLQLIEPWLAAGKVVGQVNSVDSARTCVVLHVDHARLLIPLKAELFPHEQQASTSANTPSDREVVFVVPGIPESSQAFLLSPVALRSLTSQRVAGGTRIVIPSDWRGLVLLTEDPSVIQSFRQRIARDRPRVARLQRGLAEQRAKAAVELGQRLTKIGYRGGVSPPEIAAIASQLRQVDALLSSGRVEPAYELATAVTRSLIGNADAQRRTLTSSSTIVSHPLALTGDQIADYAEFSQATDSLPGGENLLYGGDFEDLRQMTQSGWQHVRHARSGIEAGAKLSPREPRHGTRCLELFAAAAPAESPGFVDGAPIWIISPAMPVDEGAVVAISGSIRIDEAIAGSVDGLQIVDTLGGAELSLAVRETSGWQAFRIIRGVPATTELRLTFALSGLGSACIDGVMVRVLRPPAARRLPALSPMDRSATNGAQESGPLFVEPATR